MARARQSALDSESLAAQRFGFLCAQRDMPTVPTLPTLPTLLDKMDMGLAESNPITAWVLERLLVSGILFCFLWLLRTCWRGARANQKLALVDTFEYTGINHSERRSLLLPVPTTSRNGYRR